MRAFDRAVEVYQTPIPYGFAIRPHLRPYHVEATQEMIDEGNHREAMYWITCLDTAYLALQNDAPDAEKPVFAAQLQAMQAALGFTSAEAWAERVAAAERLARRSTASPTRSSRCILNSANSQGGSSERPGGG